jgi:tol-pal system protein YbgF
VATEAGDWKLETGNWLLIQELPAMKCSRTLPLLVVALLVPTAAHAAANKEHLQLMAEIRMLQEQQQQLQALLGNLTDALKTVSGKLDDQSAAMRKAMADQALTISNVGENVRVLREKADDTNVRISSVSQEIEALRQALASQPSTQVAAPPPTGTDPTMPGGMPGAPGTAAAPGTTGTAMNPIPVGVSQQRMFDNTMDDYTAGRFDLAIQGFQSFIQAFPRSPKAAEAQLNIGHSYYNQSKWSEAADAFQKVIADYPQSPSVSEAYFKLGASFERMNQLDAAKKAYDTVMKSYPNTVEASLAKQALERLNRRE